MSEQTTTPASILAAPEGELDLDLPTPTADAERDAADPRRRRRRRALQVVVGLVLGLGLAEAAFWLRDDGAFPHANFYVADPELGVRLQPGASMRFHLGDNPTSTITVNAQGFRGQDWPEPEAAQILVLGDSQVFGLGVNDEETFSSRLETLTGRSVLNAGVPTYGPREYAALAEELLEARRPRTVVYVLNFLNDPFELERPNVERHAVWDGWAVRIETAPDTEDLLEFPGRQWLMSRSHLVYGVRRWWHERDPDDGARIEAADHGVPSEGQWQDLLTAEQAASEAATAAALAKLRSERALMIAAPQPQAPVEIEEAEAPEQAERSKQARIADLDRRIAALDRKSRQGRRSRGNDAAILAKKPGDIIRDRRSESSRSVTITAQMYNDALDRKRARELEASKAAEARGRLVARRDFLIKVEARAPEPEPEPEPAPAPTPVAPVVAQEVAPQAVSVFEPHLAELAALCQRHDAQLLVVALPFDVQVSSEEWAKYGVEDGPDMAPTLVLLDDLGASAARLGVASLDATAALRAAEPGAFLDADIHMTAKGHDALAEAIATALETID